MDIAVRKKAGEGELRFSLTPNTAQPNEVGLCRVLALMLTEGGKLTVTTAGGESASMRREPDDC